MNRPLFSRCTLPMLVTSLTDDDAGKTISTMRNAIYDGTDGFMIHMERLKPEMVNQETLENIFNYACDKPLYTMNYRGPGVEKSDEQLMEEQIMAVRAGASMIDMMGDMFGRAPLELTFDEKAVAKQKEVIDRVHALGGEVLLSSHTFVYMTADEVLRHTKTLEARGADFIKIAMSVHNEEELMDAMKTTTIVSRELKVPFLHICMGQYGKLHRAIGPMLGSCFALCVQQYTPAGHKEKPLLRAEKAVFDHIDYHPGRNTYVGTGTAPGKEKKHGI